MTAPPSPSSSSVGYRYPFRIVAWTRAHRRFVSVTALIVIVVLLVLEIGVRVVTPDAMEVIEYSYTVPHTVVSDYLVTNPVEAATTYRAHPDGGELGDL